MRCALRRTTLQTTAKADNLNVETLEDPTELIVALARCSAKKKNHQPKVIQNVSFTEARKQYAQGVALAWATGRWAASGLFGHSGQ